MTYVTAGTPLTDKKLYKLIVSRPLVSVRKGVGKEKIYLFR